MHWLNVSCVLCIISSEKGRRRQQVWNEGRVFIFTKIGPFPNWLAISDQKKKVSLVVNWGGFVCLFVCLLDTESQKVALAGLEFAIWTPRALPATVSSGGFKGVNHRTGLIIVRTIKGQVYKEIMWNCSYCFAYSKKLIFNLISVHLSH